MLTQFQAERGPRIEMVPGRHRSAGTVRAADGPVLVESRGTLDGGLVDTLGLVDIVG